MLYTDADKIAKETQAHAQVHGDVSILTWMA